MPVNAVAEIIGEHDTRIWRVLEHYVKEARSNERFSEVHSVGVDETSKAKGHNYISVFVDLDNSKVIHVCEGRDSKTVTSFKNDYEDHKGSAKNITNFCCDMSLAFISGIESEFENAAITFDRFHVMKLMNEAIDQVRREEQIHNVSLKRTRYIWLKNPENLTEKQKIELGSLKDMSLKTSKAYEINTRIDNGVLEGMNSLIQSAKSSATGFRSTKNLIITIYLRLGKLNFNLPT